MNLKVRFILGLVACLCLYTWASCRRVPVGYLDVRVASFKPKEGYAYKELLPESNWVKYKSPFSSTQIQGVSGTEPINYDFASVKASEGGDAALFRQCVEQGTVQVKGGRIYLHQEAAQRLPLGRYLISIRVYNEDHTAIVPDAFTFILQQKQPEEETTGSEQP